MVKKQRRSRPRRKQNEMLSTTMDIVKTGVVASVGIGTIGAVAGALKP